ncbi:MAG TPA: hypothetical protein VFO06_09635 [Gemmatimonadales bacterium]|nr:hypothetical protein [Gemmatimonadales bacterium]
MRHRPPLFALVETAERLPPVFRPPFWGALLGLAISAVLVVAALPVWLVEGRHGIIALGSEIILAGAAGGIVGGLLAALLGGFGTKSGAGYYLVWMLAHAVGALMALAVLRGLDRGDVMGLGRPLAPWILAGLGAVTGLVVARALLRSRSESPGEFRQASHLVAEALLAEMSELERRAGIDSAVGAELQQVRQGGPSPAYIALLERVGLRLERGSPATSDLTNARAHVAMLVAKARDDVRRLAEDPGFAAELRRREEMADILFRREVDREAKRLRRSGETGKQ